MGNNQLAIIAVGPTEIVGQVDHVGLKNTNSGALDLNKPMQIDGAMSHPRFSFGATSPEFTAPKRRSASNNGISSRENSFAVTGTRGGRRSLAERNENTVRPDEESNSRGSRSGPVVISVDRRSHKKIVSQ